MLFRSPLGEAAREDEYEIGRSAIRQKIPAITTLSGARAAVRGIRRLMAGTLTIHSLQELFPD